MDSAPIGLEEKQQALQLVLASRTFRRSDQLRNFLRYICEAEFEGRTQDINEYSLGVTVLGRRPDFNPAEESCVRGRAYELRNKLKSYYQKEAPHAPIRIEVQKGGYVPSFERWSQETSTAEEALSLPQERPSRTMRNIVPLLVAGFVLLVVVASVSLFSLYKMQRASQMANLGSTQELELFWQPLLESNAPLLLSYDTKRFYYAPGTGLVVRDSKTNSPEEMAKSKPLAEFQKRMGTTHLEETQDYADAGSVNAAFSLGRFLGPKGRKIGMKRSSLLDWDDIWNNNIVFLGKPSLNPAIHDVLKEGDFVDSEDGACIRNLHPLAGELTEYRHATTHGDGEKFAIITLLPGPQTGRHILILDGVGSEILSALATAVTDPATMKDFLAHLKTPSGKAPDAFQIVIQARFESYIPVKIRYVTHHALKLS